MSNEGRRSRVRRLACALAGLVVGTAVLAAPAIAVAPGVQGFVVWSGKPGSPVVMGDKSVWCEGNPDGGSLMLFDADTCKTTTFRSGGYSSYFSDLAFDGLYVVWADTSRSGEVDEPDLYVYDTVSKVTTRLGALSERADEYEIDLSDGRAAFAGVYDGVTGVWVVDVRTKEATRVAEAGGQAAISGEWVVWTDGPELHAESMSTPETKTFAGSFSELDFDGTRVVYVSEENIYCLDIATGATTAVCTDAWTQSGPHIAGSYVVWEDERLDPGEGYTLSRKIYGLDLSGGAERLLDGPAWDPRTDGVSVVWVAGDQMWCAKTADRPASSISLTTSTTVVPYGSTATFTGRLTGAGDTPLAGGRVRLWEMALFGFYADPVWFASSIATTTADGAFTLTDKPLSRRTYRVEYLPLSGDVYGPSTSATVTVEPKADAHIGWSKTKTATSTAKKATRYHPPDVYAMIGDGGFNDGHSPVLETWKWQKVGGVYTWVLRFEGLMYWWGKGTGTWKGHGHYLDTPFRQGRNSTYRSFTAGKYRVRVRTGGANAMEDVDEWLPAQHYARAYSPWAYITVK
jgi:hypothetical protein